MFVEGGFGKFIIGSEANGTALLHVMAPDAAGNTDTDGILTGGWAVVAPTAAAGGHDFNARGTTAIDTDDNADKITYVAPTFYGLTVGASYVPNSKEDDRGPTKLNNNATVAAGEIFGAGALYANTFGGLGVKVSAGWVAYDVEAGVLDKTGVNEYALGSQLSYAGFTLGGSFRKINSKDSLVGTLAADATVWDAGLQYASGPYAISFVYFESKQAVTTTQDDTLSVYQVSGKYALGPGVDVLATAGHAEYESDIAGPNNNNEGWAVMTGLSLAF
ncbi:MAG: porin [Magnetospirillum sp.]|nr:porin [Magnetospirillum sp.]